MVFSHRMAALAAVVVIPLGIAATSFALSDRPDSPKVPAKVELDSGSPSASPDSPTPSDEVVPPPPATDVPPTTSPTGGDDDDDRGGSAGDDDGPGGDG
ncbi:small secreted hydrophilic protein [Streptomyces sp. NPDC058001]|uniref:small secreted hydrophilic protein n=1 Tax=Streptomyces sp. NPDC058001 TaxID=3346300 RepID=UPI0036EB1323